MLMQKLYDINWDEKGAPLIPKLLMQMCSEYSYIRDKAYRDFAREILHEDGSMEGIDEGAAIRDLLKSDAHILMLTFLIEILVTTKIVEKDRILWFLHTMTRYAEYSFYNYTFPHDANYRKIYPIEIREKIWSYHEL